MYLGWTGFFTIFAFVVLVWLEILLASSQSDTDLRRGRFEADAASFSIVWTMLGVVEIAAFVLLYIVQ